jgi:hypothetical protein
MSGIPDIIDSKIVGTEWDALWQDTGALPEAKLLVITAPYSPGSAEAVQLQKMMQACGLEAKDHYVVQLQSWEMKAWHSLRDAVKPEAVLVLGISPKQLGISVQFYLYAPNRFNDTIWIAAPSLSDMEQQPDAKKQLWQLGLKPVFVDKTISLP